MGVQSGGFMALYTILKNPSDDVCGGFSRNVWRRRVIGWQVRLKSKSMIMVLGAILFGVIKKYKKQ